MNMKTYLYRLFKWLTKGVPVTRVNAGITTIDASQKLAGKKILVTGGSKGIGFHLAQKFLSEGAEVVIIGRNGTTLNEAANRLGCHSICCDITNISQLDRLIGKAAELMGGINCLVNNAGICNIDNGFMNVSEDSYDQQFLTNVKSPFFLTQSFVKWITANNAQPAAVLFITSERGKYPDDAPYGMTKAAMANIIPGLARQFAAKDIRFNAIAPGVTADVLGNPDMMEDLYLKGSVGKRFFLPQELAEVATFLISDASKCISGEEIACDQANYYK